MIKIIIILEYFVLMIFDLFFCFEMGKEIVDYIRDADFYTFLQALFDSKFYDLVFPFLLIYAVISTVLYKVKIFQNKDGKPVKGVVIVISLIISFFGVSFETSPGYTVGNYLMMLFPNISALTVMILGLYVVGSILGKDFFKGIFRKDHSAYMYFTVAVIGLGSVIYYLGIVMGFWDQYPITQESYWNMIIGIGFLIMGIVFLFIDLVPIGVVFLTIFGVFVYNYGDEGSILEYFVDPVVLIALIFIVVLAWMNSDGEEKLKIEKNIKEGKKTRDRIKNQLGFEPKDYENKIYDIVTQSLKNNEEKLKKRK